MQITKLHAALLAVLITLTGCSKNTGIGGAAGDASETTLKANALFGVLSRNRRNFRHPSSSPATSASRSIILPSLWKV